MSATNENETIEVTRPTVRQIVASDAKRLKALMPKVDEAHLARIQSCFISRFEENDKLVECTWTQGGCYSITRAMRECAYWDIEPDRVHAHLIPRKHKKGYMECHFQFDYKGLVEIASRTGWSIRCGVVMEGHLKHAGFEIDEANDICKIPKLFNPPDNDRDLVGAWAKAVHRDGTVKVLAIDKTDVERAQSASQTDNIWKKFPDAMWSKTALRALWKTLPKLPQNTRWVAQVEELREMGKSNESLIPLEARAKDVTPDEGEVSIGEFDIEVEADRDKKDGDLFGHKGSGEQSSRREPGEEG